MYAIRSYYGFDRYYQITKCFRDEDLRADRQPEFTQVDIETSFMTEDAIMNLMESLIRTVFAESLDVQLPNPFPRMPYAEAMARFGSDKPDMRVTLEFTDLVITSYSIHYTKLYEDYCRERCR